MVNMFEKPEVIKDGMRKSFKDVDSKVANRICYGYSKLENGELTVNETKADIVRFIFDRYLSGDSLGKITKALEQNGIVSPTGKAKWNKEAINKLISNEKYTGQVMLQNTHLFCGLQFTNNGELDKFLITNHHPAIISAEIFSKVQELKNLRSKEPKEEMTMTFSY